MQKAGGSVATLGNRVAAVGNSMQATLSGAIPGAGLVAASAFTFLADKAISAATAVFGFGRSAFDSIVQTGRLAERLNVTTDDLAAMRLAASKSGLAAEDLARPMEHVGRVVAQAAEGSKEAAASFQQLGLDFEELGRMSPLQMLVKVETALGGIANVYSRNALAFKLIGKQAGEAKLAFAALGNDLLALREKANRFGIVLSPVDIKAVQAAKRAAGEVGLAWDGMKNRIAVAIAPLVEQWATTQSAALVEFGQSVLGRVGDLTQFYNTVTAVFSGTSEMVRASITKVGGYLSDFGSFMGLDALLGWDQYRSGTASVLKDIEFMFRNWALVLEQVQVDMASRLVKGWGETKVFFSGLNPFGALISKAFGPEVAAVFAADIENARKAAAAANAGVVKNLKADEDKILRELGERWDKFDADKKRQAGERAKLNLGGGQAGGGVLGLGLAALNIGKLGPALLTNFSDLLPPALEKGSKEAFEAIAKAQRAGEDTAPALAKEQLEAQKKIAENVKRVEEAIKAAPALQPAPL